MVRAFETMDGNGVALPANWSYNALIGDHAIAPPAKHEETAIERPDEYECYDWWLWHKKL